MYVASTLWCGTETAVFVLSPSLAGSSERCPNDWGDRSTLTSVSKDWGVGSDYMMVGPPWHLFKMTLLCQFAVNLRRFCYQFWSSVLQRFSLRIITLIVSTSMEYYCYIYCGLCVDHLVDLPVNGVSSWTVKKKLFVFRDEGFITAQW